MLYDAVIFDLDGTLTESGEGIIRSAAHALKAMGRPVLPEEEMRRFIGPPLLWSFREYGRMTEEEAQAAVVKYRERYEAVGWAENAVYTGIPAMLKALKRAGAYLAVATGKPQVFTDRILDLFGLRPYFDAVVGISPDDHEADKRRLISAALPKTYRRACMVGDRRFDIEAARALGLDAVGALYGYGSREELEQAGATAIAETPDVLAGILLAGLPRERGVFCTFEGPDGCGKTTQMKLLAEWLKTCGWRVKTTREPGGGPISEAIRNLVLDPAVEGMTDECEAYLFAASRAQHVRDTIRPALERGEVVLCDRFLDSSVAFQGGGRGLGVGTVKEINRVAVDGTFPDATFLFTIDPDAAMRRRLDASAPDRIEREKSEFVGRVYEAFLGIAREEPERVLCVSAEGTIEAIQREVRERALPLLSRMQ